MAKTMQNLLKDYDAGKPLVLPQDVIDAYGANLAGALDGDKAFASRMLTLPSFTQELKQYDPDSAYAVAQFVAKTLAEAFKSEFLEVYTKTTAPAGEKYDVSSEQMGRRELHNTCLTFLGKLQSLEVKALAEQQYAKSKNMTEKLGGLTVLSRLPGEEGAKALETFYQTYKKDTNVMDTWLTVSAQVPGADVVARVKELMNSDVFDLTNPNKVRALLSGFASNTKAFHNKDGSGYKLLADVIITLNDVNAHTATGIISPLAQFSRYDDARQKLVVEQLKRIMATPKLNTQIKDIVGKALATAAPQKKKSAAFNLRK